MTTYMTDNKAVMQQALDALESVLDDDKDVLKASISGGLYEVVDCQRSIASLRAAIAQPEQTSQSEPVAWQWLNTGTFRKTLPKTTVVADWKPLYAHPIAQPKDKP